jgi:thiol peroxidase
MATTNFKGQPVKLIGEFIQVGKVAPDFELVKSDLSSFALKDLKGKNIVLNIFPSLDTGVCATSVRKFNKMAAGMKDIVVLAISKDLPFAQGRFCTTEGIENVIPLSDFRFSDFDESYVVQKRPWANGKSFEMANTTVSFIPAAILLNLRTEVAHTPVSRLGKIFRTIFLPFRSFSAKEDKSLFTSSKSGATFPTCINSPISFTGCPLKFVVAIIDNSKFYLLYSKQSVQELCSRWTII